MTRLRRALRAASLVFTAATARAGSFGHYPPTLLNSRDFFLPPPGMYAGVSSGYYDALRDSSRLDLFIVAPGAFWVSPWKALGGRYAAGIAPVLVGTPSRPIGLGDVFVSPLTLGWSGPSWDASGTYAFYVPTGEIDRTGLGFWTNLLQEAVAWYPGGDRRTALSLAVTEELHASKRGRDYVPGPHLTINWALTRYVPLGGGSTLELSPIGFSQWQLADDRGADVFEPARSEVHAAGAQVGVFHAGSGIAVNARYLNELKARNRFAGEWFALNVGGKLW